MNARQILEQLAIHFMVGSEFEHTIPEDEFNKCEGINQALTALSTLLISELESLKKYGETNDEDMTVEILVKLSDAIEKIKEIMKGG